MEVEITPDDARYEALCTGMNQRWTASPEKIYLVTSTAEVVRAVQSAVSAGQRITVRSGGHCYRDFVSNNQVQVIVDMSEMADISYDPELGAIAVSAGSRLLDVYETLYRRWNVTIPGGHCPTVGVGGHIVGGGFGLLSRRHGLTVDHLYAVEVVVVDASGTVRSVVATREESDPNRDLWWAHTGGGGGNFGVITRYWFRTPGVVSDKPAELLPSPPRKLLVSTVFLPWAEFTEADFKRLVQNYGDWYTKHSAANRPEAAVAGYLILNSRAAGNIALLTQVDADEAGADVLLAEYNASLTAGVNVQQNATLRRLPWLKATQQLAVGSPALNDPTLRGEYKSAYFRSSLLERQVDACYRYLSRPDYPNRNAMVLLLPYGGRVNTVDVWETASQHRDSVLKMLVQSLWIHADDDVENVEWVRGLYAEAFAETGGVPVSNEVTDGCFINYPDTDLNDPKYNSSGVSWSELYYKDGYLRLQRVKAAWDPLNIFRHAQSVELPRP